MAKKHSSTTKAVKPPETDDLKLIIGIGPAVESRLNGVGIFTFAQLAALSPADIAATVADLSGLSAERIIKQDWIGQAHQLASELSPVESQKDVEAPLDHPLVASITIEPQTPQEHFHSAGFTEEPQKGAVTPTEHLHAAMFMVELQLDENNNVRSTQVVYVQSGSKQTWTGWQNKELEAFLVKSAGLRIAGDRPVLPAPTEIEPPPVPTRPILAGVLHLRSMEALGVDENHLHGTLPHNQPFDILLTLDFSELTVSGSTALNYKASIYGKSLDKRQRQIVGEAEGMLVPADSATIKVKGKTLPQGTYHLVATVTLSLPNMKASSRPGHIAVLDGGLLQVY